MAACYDPQMMPTPPHPVSRSPPQQVSCVGLLYDSASNRTFRIPDVPQTSTVAHIKQWYASNVGDSSTDPRSLVVIHNANPCEDSIQVWQLAQGQGQFAVTVAPAHSPRSTFALYVDTTLPIPPVRLCVSSDSTVLYVKQRLFEMLNMPMALASAVQTVLMLAPSSAPLQNACTLEACNVVNNARLVFTFQNDMAMHNATPLPEPMIPTAPRPAPLTPQGQFARIQEIWASDTSTESTPSTSPASTSPVHQPAAPPASHALLPSLLFEDDEEVSRVPRPSEPAPNNNQNNSQSDNNGGRPQKGRSRNRRSRSPPGGEICQPCLNQEQLQHLAANFRTKTCRNGPSCKFGRNCWFAHTSEELRKPSDPLPNNLPAVHKLERYSHREANSSKDRN